MCLSECMKNACSTFGYVPNHNQDSFIFTENNYKISQKKTKQKPNSTKQYKKHKTVLNERSKLNTCMTAGISFKQEQASEHQWQL